MTPVEVFNTDGKEDRLFLLWHLNSKKWVFLARDMKHGVRQRGVASEKCGNQINLFSNKIIVFCGKRVYEENV
jgi:hypothetical protein